MAASVAFAPAAGTTAAAHTAAAQAAATHAAGSTAAKPKKKSKKPNLRACYDGTCKLTITKPVSFRVHPQARRDAPVHLLLLH
ncbi:hypothetical protein WBK31_07070 [Nonomuraea sp. N2-4H]|uniref:hypothetical protein n=1 Tax=unclassified Nonomuraea TaxID=2593643 RepID=UPI00324B52AB